MGGRYAWVVRGVGRGREVWFLRNGRLPTCIPTHFHSHGSFIPTVGSLFALISNRSGFSLGRIHFQQIFRNITVPGRFHSLFTLVSNRRVVSAANAVQNPFQHVFKTHNLLQARRHPERATGGGTSAVF